MSDRERLRGYVLGLLSEAEAEEVETRLMVDEDLHERVELEQDAVVEAHVRGALVPAEEAAFSARLAADAALRQTVARSRLLYERLRAPSRAGVAPARWLALAALLLLGLASWWWLSRPPAQPGTAGRPSSAPTLTPSGAPRPQPTASETSPARVATLTLSPGQAMAGAAVERVALDPASKRLVLELVLEGPVARRYGAELWSASERPLWRAGEVAADVGEGTVTVELPAERLAAGHYRLELFPLTAQGRGPARPYHFEVRR